MAVWGIGAKYNGSQTSLISHFTNNGVACVGYTKDTAPDIIQVMKSIKIGDLIFIKTRWGNTIFIKAIGIITDNKIVEVPNFENPESTISQMKVDWLIRPNKHIPVKLEKNELNYNAFRNTIYEEFNPKVLYKVIECLSMHIK